MIRRITKHGETVLKKKAASVDFKAMKSKLPALLQDMWDTMYSVNGVGLAAPQIGVPLRISVIDIRPEGKPERLVLINPEILSKEGKLTHEEGCLSIPGLYAKIERYDTVRLRALGEDGCPWERTGTGLLARAFQHECDHLEGKLFIDHLDLAERLKVAGVLKELRKEWD